MEFLSRFNYSITYVKGEENIVADALSRYYESDAPGETHPLQNYVNVDSKLDPNRDNLSNEQVQELHAMRNMEVLQAIQEVEHET